MTTLDFSYVKEYFLSFGYAICDDSEYRGVVSKLTICDEDGYLYHLSFDAFRTSMKSNYFPRIVGKSNPFSTENMVKWINLNAPSFQYISGEFINSHEKNIVVRCLICNKKQKTCWNYIEVKQPCSSDVCLHKRAVNAGRKKYLTNENNLSRAFPEIAKEWDFEKNELLPSDYCPNSDYDAAWICSFCEHGWKTKIKNRTFFNKIGRAHV